MPNLRNVRRVDGRHGPEVWADFTVSDGRIGSVGVSLAKFEAHGEKALELEAAACARQARSHSYRALEEDRYRELR